MNRIFYILKYYKQELILGLFIILYTSYFSFFTIIRHLNLYSMRYDLGNMIQTIWNSSEGRLFVMTNPSGVENVSRFVFHGDFFLVFLAFIYKILPFPEVILFIQSFFIALSAIPLYFFSR